MPPKNEKLDQIAADAQRNSAQRELGYREQALKQYPARVSRMGLPSQSSARA